MNLLTQNIFVTSGTICLNDVNFKDVSLQFFEKNVAYISQDVELFNLSLKDNLTLKKKISKKTLEKVIKGCCLSDLVKRMNGDLSTIVGEKGIRVSAGEKQRINLARGLLLNRDILVLDEITANLDPKTTQSIWDFVFKEYADKTIIAISHEEKLISYVGRIIRFKNGKMTEVKE